jgi:hypothetical protein
MRKKSGIKPERTSGAKALIIFNGVMARVELAPFPFVTNSEFFRSSESRALQKTIYERAFSRFAPAMLLAAAALIPP